MSNCIKTGAVVRFLEWNTNVPCDLHEVADVIVLKFYPDRFHHSTSREVTHKVFIGSSGYLDKSAGIAVVSKEFLKAVGGEDES